VVHQANTWMRTFKEVFVFSDEFPNNTCKTLNRLANPCVVKCVSLGNMAEHLEGTEWTHRWYYAQPRFLPAMFSLYEHRPVSNWFLFGDDDTYFFRKPLMNKITVYNPNDPVVVGKFWCTWNGIIENIQPKRKCHPFAQGGAGVLVSNHIITHIAPNLLNCSKQFNDPDFAGSMRFALCAERTFGTVNWTNGNYIHPWFSGFHSSPPDFEISDGTVTEAPASFHRIENQMFYRLSSTHIIIIDSNTIIDLSAYAFTRHIIYLGNMDTRFEWRFGYAISEINHKTPLFYSSSNWTSIFNNRTLNRIYQEYDNGILMNCQCDSSMNEGDSSFVKFLDDNGKMPLILISCKSFDIM